MGQPSSKRRRALFWVGVVLLSISALWWILLIVSGGDTDDTVITKVITTIVPVGIGIYCVRRGRKRPAAEMERGPEPTYASQPAVAPRQGTLWAPELGYPSERAAKPVQRSSIGPKKRKKLKIGANMSRWEDSWWKMSLFGMGIVVACIAVIGSVFSLPINKWLKILLLFALGAVNMVSLHKLTKLSDASGLGAKELLKKYWVYTLPYIATGILVIYTIIGVILGNIEWVYPGGYKGP